MATAAGRGEIAAGTPPAETTAELARRAGPAIVAGGVFAWLIVRMAFDAGGYFPPTYLRAGVIAFVTVAALLVVARPRYALSTQALVAILALGGLALWTGLSSLWSPAPSAAVEAMQRDLSYLALLALGLIAAGSGRYARQLVWLGLGVICVICGAALIARLFPDWIADGRGVAGQDFRLAYPLTYWNALGALAGVGAVLAFGLAADPKVRWAMRGVAGGVTVPLVVALTMTLSRGAWLAVIVGVVVLVALGAHRGSLVLTAGIVGGGCAIALLRLNAYPAIIDDPVAAGGQQSAGHAFAPQLVLLSVATGVALAAFGAARASPLVMSNLERAFRPLAIGLTAVAAVLLLAGYAAHSSNADGLVAKQLADVGDWFDRQQDAFMQSAGPPSESGTARLTSGASGTRSEVYRVALDGFGDSPFKGQGAGSFKVRWNADRRIGEQTINAHSLELETLSELGVVGGLLLAALLGTIGYAAVRSRLRPGGLTRSQSAAVGAACTVWAVHSAVDWDWQMGALTGIVLLLACTLFPRGRRRVRRRRTRPAV